MISRALSNRRLLMLARFLEKLKKGRFYYGNWTGEDWKGNPDLSCGTSACAMGWAAAMPAFVKLGLTIGTDGVPVDTKNDAYGERAGCRVFGLTDNEANALFVGNRLIDYKHKSFFPKVLLEDTDFTDSAKKVAKRIRKFVEVR